MTKTARTAKAPKLTREQILEMVPDLPAPFFWNPTNSGASLMKDERKTTGKRPYIGHFSLNVLKIVFKGQTAAQLGLTGKRAEEATRKAGELTQLLASIKAEAAA